MYLRRLSLPTSFSEKYRLIDCPPWCGMVDRRWHDDLTSSSGEKWIRLVGLLHSVVHPARSQRVLRWDSSAGGKPEAIWLKIYDNSSFIQRLARLLGCNKATRAWENAWFLIGCSVATPRPVLALLSPWWRRQPEWLGFEEFSGSETFTLCYARHIRSGNGAEALVRSVGHFIAHLHQSNCWHRDLNGSNVLVRESAVDKFELCLIDVNRMRHSDRMNQYKRVHDLVRLGLARSDYAILLRAYEGVTGVVVDQQMLQRGLDHSQRLHAARKANSYLRWWFKITYHLGKIRNFRA
mgnify:CR=1 FL=1